MLVQRETWRFVDALWMSVQRETALWAALAMSVPRETWRWPVQRETWRWPALGCWQSLEIVQIDVPTA